MKNIAEPYKEIFPWPIFRIFKIKLKIDSLEKPHDYTDMTYRLANIILIYLIDFPDISNPGEKGRRGGVFVVVFFKQKPAKNTQ